MTGFANNLISGFAKRARVRPAPTRLRRTALRLDSLEQRSLLTAMVPIGAPLPDPMSAGADIELSAEVSVNCGATVAADVVVDGRIITGQNFDSASSGDPSIVRKISGRTSVQPAGTSAYGGSAGYDIIFGGLGDDFLLSRASGGHVGGVNMLLSDGSVRSIRASILDGDIVPTNDVMGETDAGAATSGPFQSEYKYVPVRRTASSASGDTGADFGGRQVDYTGLEQASSDGSARSADDQTIDFSALFEFVEGAAATGGHVKVFNAAGVGEIRSFLAFQGFPGGISVAASTPVGGPANSLVLTLQGDRLDPALEYSGITNGSTKIVVGVIDTGIDYRHADLYINIWINQAPDGSGDDFVNAASTQSSIRVHYDIGYSNSITIRSVQK